MAQKLRTLDTLGLGKVKHRKSELSPTIDEKRKTGFDKLLKYQQYWSELYQLRKERQRSRNYLLGNQWGDTVVVNGQSMTEEAYIKSQGRIPLTNNQILQTVNAVIGQFRNNTPETVVLARAREKQSVAEMLQNAIEACKTNGKSEAVDSAQFREFMVSGAAIGRIGYKYIKEKNRSDAYFSNCHINRMFFNTDIEDPRLDDLRVIGQFVDTSIDNIIATFAQNEADEEVIRKWYEPHWIKEVVSNHLTTSKFDSMDFFHSPENDTVRLFEAWELLGEWRVRIHDPLNATYETKKETKELYARLEKENNDRMMMYTEQGVPLENIPLIDYKRVYEEFWYFYFITPGGNIISEGESPYRHESHPFVMHLHPLIDGVVKGYVSGLIDQQRYINRTIILIDFMISASAKGVLLVPEDAIPAGMDISDFADEWTKFNGVIKIKAKAGTPMPEQIAANNTNIGVFDLLNLQMGLFEKISGVSGAIQGQRPSSGTPASRYAMEAQNSAINLVDLFKTFIEFLESRDQKLLKTIVQFYDTERYIAINGTSYSDEAKTYNPELARSIDCDMKVIEGTSTPVFRQMQDEFLFKLFESQAIDAKMLLQNSSIPMADKLLDQIEKRESAMQGGAMPGQMPPEVMQAIQSGQNPQATKMVQNALNM